MFACLFGCAPPIRNAISQKTVVQRTRCVTHTNGKPLPVEGCQEHQLGAFGKRKPDLQAFLHQKTARLLPVG